MFKFYLAQASGHCLTLVLTVDWLRASSNKDATGCSDMCKRRKGQGDEQIGNY